MKVYFKINFAIINDAIHDANSTLSSAIVGLDSDQNYNNYLIKDLAKLAFNEMKKKYPNDKLALIDYSYLGEDVVFVNI